MAGAPAAVGAAEGRRKAGDCLIVALDVASLEEARTLVDEFADEISFYKLGPQLFETGLIDFIGRLVEMEKRVFLDFKTADIGETMRRMIDRVSRLGVEFATVMGTGSAVSAATSGRGHRLRPKILAVTVLTDCREADMQREYNTKLTIEEFVAERARMAAAAGADGVIASAREAGAIRGAVPRSDFLIVTPGIRPAGTPADDQARIATPRAAIMAGADYLVVGRPIIGARDKLAAARAVMHEMQQALDARAD